MTERIHLSAFLFIAMAAAACGNYHDGDDGLASVEQAAGSGGIEIRVRKIQALSLDDANGDDEIFLEATSDAGSLNHIPAGDPDYWLFTLDNLDTRTRSMNRHVGTALPSAPLTICLMDDQDNVAGGADEIGCVLVLALDLGPAFVESSSAQDLGMSGGYHLVRFTSGSADYKVWFQ